MLPRAFAFPSEPPDIVTPMQPERVIAFLGNFGPRGLARLEDGVTIAEANTDVVGTALLAAYLPLRRLTRVDPMHALRAE